MRYCQYCRTRVGKNAVSCPSCGASLVDEAAAQQEFERREELSRAKDRANMYFILATVLATAGIIVGGGLVVVSSSLLGLFGIVFICLAIGCTAAADRHERKARSLRHQLGR